MPSAKTGVTFKTKNTILLNVKSSWMASVKIDLVAENLNSGKVRDKSWKWKLIDVCLKIEFSLTCVGNALTVVGKFEQILQFQNQNQLNKKNDSCHGAHINGLCVLDKCFRTVKSEFEIAKHG